MQLTYISSLIFCFCGATHFFEEQGQCVSVFLSKQPIYIKIASFLSNILIELE